jgi:CxxC motif-containing protein (DUF1111 family)
MRTSSCGSLVSRIAVPSLVVVLTATAFWLLTPSRLRVVKAQTTLGGPIANLTTLETQMFNQGKALYLQNWDAPHGLGPVYTQTQCSGCHQSPVAGGGAPGNGKKDTLFGALNSDGSFNPLTNEGGILLQNQSISQFQPSCVLAGEVVPADATLVDKRLPPQNFGMGLIDAIPDSLILAQAAAEDASGMLGVAGTANMVTDQNGNTVVGKFGYKAESATLVQIVAEAMNGELGLTNPIAPNEQLPQGQPIPPACNTAPEPNDDGSRMVSIYHFVVYLAPNQAGMGNSNGQALFTSVGCSLCHLSPTTGYTTGANVTIPVVWNGRTIVSQALSNQPVPLYSDLLLHDMGPGLADGFPFGQATGSQFRTTPLWGLSTRTTYLHDGRASKLQVAILEHGGEATQVIGNFRKLSPSDQADLISFIGSL